MIQIAAERGGLRRLFLVPLIKAGDAASDNDADEEWTEGMIQGETPRINGGDESMKHFETKPPLECGFHSLGSFRYY